MPKTKLQIYCAWCRQYMGEKDGKGVEGKSHSICEKCWHKEFPGVPYPKEGEDGYGSPGQP